MPMQVKGKSPGVMFIVMAITQTAGVEMNFHWPKWGDGSSGPSGGDPLSGYVACDAASIVALTHLVLSVFAHIKMSPILLPEPRRAGYSADGGSSRPKTCYSRI